MDYKLAKKLKDNGFPQIPQHEFVCKEGAGEDECVTKPRLSELIDACGDGFELESEYWDVELAQEVSSWHSLKAIKDPDDDREYVHGYGRTPEEAVAKLWLELNKKK